MKKILSILLFTLIIYSSNVQSTHAQWAVACVNCSTWTQQLIDYAKQGLQYGSSLVTEGASLTTAQATTISMIKDTLLNPIADSLISIAQQYAANNIVTWANTGFEGNSLIIGNPEQYTQDKGTEAVKGLLTNIPEGSVYEDSLFSAIVDNVKYSDPDSQLSSLSQSTIPSIVQNNACTDEALNRDALAYVMEDDGTYNQADFIIRKKTLSDSLCVGNPKEQTVEGRALAQRLIAANKQNPSLGGWDTWLATTGGQNDYTVTTRGTILADKVRADKEEDQKAELAQGGGTASDKMCVKYYPTNENNPTPLCKEYKVLTPSGMVESSVSKATTAGLDRLTGLQNSFSSIITGFATSFLTKGLNSAFSSSNTPNSNTSITLNARLAPVQDLATDSNRRTQIISPIQKQLNADLNSLSKLETVDRDYISEINSYKSQIENVNNCYSSLVTDFPSLQGNGSITAAQSFYTGKITTTNDLLATITNDIGLISTSRSLITNTLSAIATSNSTDEILAKYNDYQNQVDSKGLPTSITSSIRSGEYQTYKSSIQQDMGTGGSITTLLSQCSTIRSQQQQNYYYGGGTDGF